MANTKKTSARRSLLAAPTAASQRKGRVSTPPERLGANAPVANVAKKSRGRPKSNGTRGRPKKEITSKVIASKVVKKVGKTTGKTAVKVATPGKRGRPAKGSNSAADVKKSKGPKPEKVYNNELKSTAEEYQVEELKDSRVRNNKLQYLVKWVGYPNSQNTWEPEANVHNAQEAIKAFDIKFPDKEYPKPVAKKSTKVAATTKKTAEVPAEADTPPESGSEIEVEAEAEVESDILYDAEVSPEGPANE